MFFFVISKNYAAIFCLSDYFEAKRNMATLDKLIISPPLLPQPHSPLGRPCICWFILPFLIDLPFFFAIHFSLIFRWFFLWTLTACFSFFSLCVSPWLMIIIFFWLYIILLTFPPPPPTIFFKKMKSLDSELIRPKRVRKLVSVSKVPKSFSSPVNLNVSFSGRQLTQIRNLQIAEFGYGPHRKSPLFFSFFYFFFSNYFFSGNKKKRARHK